MSNKFIDNKRTGLVGNVLKDNIQEGSKVSIAAAHMTLYAFNELKEELSKVDQFRFIFTDPVFIEANNNTMEFKIKENEALIYGNDDENAYKCNLNQAYIAKEFAEWIKEKGEVKLYNGKGMKGNLYLIDNKGDENVALLGGSPFSTSGLGIGGANYNYVNSLIDDEREVSKVKMWFDNIWSDKKSLKDVKDNLVKKIELLYKDNTPQFLYFVTLFNLFKNFLEENDSREIIQSRTGFKETIVWNKLYNFQRDGVMGAVNKIETYGGCIIADSVGLGKTFEALAVIKYYELKNNRVLVLAPKKLRENWEIYRRNDKRNILLNDRFSYDLLNHTDLSRKGGKSGDIDLDYVNWGNYDLVVIDESHNFRNNVARNDRETRYDKFMKQIIKAGVKTKVLMLSATPVNNKLQDLKNQISFITEEKDDALFKAANIPSISQTIIKAQRQFNKWSEMDEKERTTEKLLDMLNWDYFKLLDSLTIARSRKHIEKYYDVKDIGEFPTRLKPRNLKSDIDEQSDFPALQTINNDILRLRLAVYSPMKYILPTRVDAYNEKYDTRVREGKGVFKQSDRENSIIYLMKASLLKRLESSVHSFAITLSNIISRIDFTLERLQSISDEYSIKMDEFESYDEDIEDMAIGDIIKVFLRDMDIIRWKQDLEMDKEVLVAILKKAKEVDAKRDKKLNNLKKEIQYKINNQINKNNKKLIIFTAFADTAGYLYENISTWAKQKYGIHSALVVGSGNPKTTLKLDRTDFNSVLTNFSPISKERNKINTNITEEIDILIATDCISEGQNLQDCDYLVNYDIHWNPVRIIQRFGRIDRLGSKNKYIQLVNFWPSIELDEYINLVGRVKERMAMVNLSSTGEEDVIDEKGNEMKDLEYRRKQLEQLQNEVIDLEDVSGNISLTDFTMDDFRMDLINYLEHNKEALDESPKGIYSVVTNDNKNIEDEVQRGVIFCLKALNYDENDLRENPLYPYYIVYVNEDGEILYGFNQVKKILDLYRSLCSKKDFILERQVADFNKETRFGKKMEKYKELLIKAVDAISGKIEEETTMSIFSLGDLSDLMSDSAVMAEDFEIISYLIIR